jgi:AraC-like DNA-binding protein
LATGTRSYGAPAIILPLFRTAVTLRAGAVEERIDRSRFVLVPSGVRFRLVAETAAPEVVTILLLDGAWARAQREYRPHIQSNVTSDVVGSIRLFARTLWMDEIVHRYVFERDVCAKHASQAASFLETELAKEVYFLGKEQTEGHARASLAHAGSDVARRALEWVDARLFDAFSLEDLARHCHTSESTLLRTFRRETGATPAAYVRERRLHEARLLLVGDRWSVGEIALRVGYTNLAAFTAAFGRRYGMSPSRARGAPTDPSELLPPHGERPRRRRRPGA